MGWSHRALMDGRGERPQQRLADTPVEVPDVACRRLPGLAPLDYQDASSSPFPSLPPSPLIFWIGGAAGAGADMC